MSVRAGRLRSFVEFQKQVPVQDASGQTTLQWQRAFGAWVRLQNAGALEMAMAEQTEARLWWTVSMHYERRIDHTMRFLYRGRIFNIAAGFTVDEANAETQLRAWEGLGVE